MDTIVRTTVDTFAACHASINKEIAALEAMARDDALLLQDIKTYAHTCRTFATGNLAYHIKSPRYGLTEYAKDDGSVDMVILEQQAQLG